MLTAGGNRTRQELEKTVTELEQGAYTKFADDKVRSLHNICCHSHAQGISSAKHHLRAGDPEQEMEICVLALWGLKSFSLLIHVSAYLRSYCRPATSL